VDLTPAKTAAFLGIVAGAAVLVLAAHNCREFLDERVVRSSRVDQFEKA
jgi:hypothetical protein